MTEVRAREPRGVGAFAIHHFDAGSAGAEGGDELIGRRFEGVALHAESRCQRRAAFGHGSHHIGAVRRLTAQEIAEDAVLKRGGRLQDEKLRAAAEKGFELRNVGFKGHGNTGDRAIAAAHNISVGKPAGGRAGHIDAARGILLARTAVSFEPELEFSGQRVAPVGFLHVHFRRHDFLGVFGGIDRHIAARDRRGVERAFPVQIGVFGMERVGAVIGVLEASIADDVLEAAVGVAFIFSVVAAVVDFDRVEALLAAGSEGEQIVVGLALAVLVAVFVVREAAGAGARRDGQHVGRASARDHIDALLGLFGRGGVVAKAGAKKQGRIRAEPIVERAGQPP